MSFCIKTGRPAKAAPFFVKSRKWLRKEPDFIEKFKKASHLSCKIDIDTAMIQHFFAHVPLLHNNANKILLKYVAKVNSIV